MRGSAQRSAHAPFVRVWLVGLALMLVAVPARADWLVTPFVGTTLAGSTNLLTFGRTAGDKKFTFGASYGWLSDGLLGIEATAAHTPHFFESGSASLVLTSGVSTATGSVIVAVPQAITGYSLRPYLLGGVGLLHLTRRDAIQFETLDSNVLALNLGGGAIGMLSNRTGVRFELRHVRNLSPDDSSTTTSGRSTRISFWTVTAGVVIRY
jgi:hypothetical protein